MKKTYKLKVKNKNRTKKNFRKGGKSSLKNVKKNKDLRQRKSNKKGGVLGITFFNKNNITYTVNNTNLYDSLIKNYNTNKNTFNVYYFNYIDIINNEITCKKTDENYFLDRLLYILPETDTLKIKEVINSLKDKIKNNCISEDINLSINSVYRLAIMTDEKLTFLLIYIDKNNASDSVIKHISSWNIQNLYMKDNDNRDDSEKLVGIIYYNTYNVTNNVLTEYGNTIEYLKNIKTNRDHYDNTVMAFNESNTKPKENNIITENTPSNITSEGQLDDLKIVDL